MKSDRIRFMIETADYDAAALLQKALGLSAIADACRYAVQRANQVEAIDKTKGALKRIAKIKEAATGKHSKSHLAPTDLKQFCLTDTGGTREAIQGIMNRHGFRKIAEAVRFAVRLVAELEKEKVLAAEKVTT